jgi:phage tail sheath protein FI
MPGIYVEEIPSASKPIEGVGTSIAAFVGFAAGGPVKRPIRIWSWTQFEKVYSDSQEPENGPFMPGAYLAHAVYGFFQNGGSLCWVVRVGHESSDSKRSVAVREGLGALAAIDEVTTVCVPDVMALVQEGEHPQPGDEEAALIEHCEAAGNRMAILDPPPALGSQDVLEWRTKVVENDSGSVGLYWPWIEVMDPLSDQPIRVPPSGHVAGVWARSDRTGGIHRAPSDAVVLGASGLAFEISEDEQASLVDGGVNCIRSFPGRGIRIWGARTLSSDPEWRYLNVSRLVNHVSRSISEGTRWAMFEANDEELWRQLRTSVSNFLTRIWCEGALFGASPEQAFYVKCDAETNPPDVIEAGQVVVEIGIAPLEPAKFAVFRISHFTAGASDLTT